MMQNSEWFNSLNKPFLNPPAEIFTPVWIFLYITIAISLFFFLKGGFTKEKIVPTIFFSIQLLLNFIWSPIFFGMQNIRLAMIVIALMWLFILLTMISFYKQNRTSGLLLLPYFLWVSFACYLNFEFLRLN